VYCTVAVRSVRFGFSKKKTHRVRFFFETVTLFFTFPESGIAAPDLGSEGHIPTKTERDTHGAGRERGNFTVFSQVSL
jgi:hypothetical protein